MHYAQSSLIELLRQKPGGATKEEADATYETSDGLAPRSARWRHRRRAARLKSEEHFD
jgi:hypothetical protein